MRRKLRVIRRAVAREVKSFVVDNNLDPLPIKTGFMPWKWQMQSAEHPDAKLPEGYTPGDVRQFMGRGEF